MKIGFWELIVVLVIALVVIGPDKLPEYARSLGKALAAMRSATADLSKDVQESIVQPLNEAQNPIKEAVNEVNDNIRRANQSLNNIGKEVIEKKPVRREWVCPSCGEKTTANFCGNCGMKKPEEEKEEDAI